VQIARRSPASTWLSGSGSPPGGRRWPGAHGQDAAQGQDSR